jgi:hypothetical protein
VRIDKGETIPAFQILERHRLQQRRFACACLPDDVYVRKAVFVFDAKYAVIIAEIGPAYVGDITVLHTARIIHAVRNC